MYTAFYGLREKPFRLTPDPRFLYLSGSHREALAHVLYGVEQGEGFIAVTGEVGTGKTTLCRTLLGRLGPRTEVAFLFNPRLSGEDLLRAIGAEFGLPVEGLSRAQLGDQLNRFLLRMRHERRRVLLIVDEAQNLSAETLEEMRLLSNLETETSKLIQILLFGQPELDATLDSRELRQLRQRIGVRWTLRPMSAAETRDYVAHRVRVAADGECELFTRGALAEVRRWARGIPRLVNLVADRALLAGYAAGASRVDRRLVSRAAREVLRAGVARTARGRADGATIWRAALVGGLGIALVAAGLAARNPGRPDGAGSAAADGSPAVGAAPPSEAGAPGPSPGDVE